MTPTCSRARPTRQQRQATTHTAASVSPSAHPVGSGTSLLPCQLGRRQLPAPQTEPRPAPNLRGEPSNRRSRVPASVELMTMQSKTLSECPIWEAISPLSFCTSATYRPAAGLCDRRTRTPPTGPGFIHDCLVVSVTPGNRGSAARRVRTADLLGAIQRVSGARRPTARYRCDGASSFAVCSFGFSHRAPTRRRVAASPITYGKRAPAPGRSAEHYPPGAVVAIEWSQARFPDTRERMGFGDPLANRPHGFTLQIFCGAGSRPFPRSADPWYCHSMCSGEALWILPRRVDRRRLAQRRARPARSRK
jgi:hypothetical protein